MKIRARKKQLQLQRLQRSKFIRDTLLGLAEAKKGLLYPYVLNNEDRAWLDMAPV